MTLHSVPLKLPRFAFIFFIIHFSEFFCDSFWKEEIESRAAAVRAAQKSKKATAQKSTTVEARRSSLTRGSNRRGRGRGRSRMSARDVSSATAVGRS